MTCETAAVSSSKYYSENSTLSAIFNQKKPEYMKYAERYHIQIRVDWNVLYFKTSIGLWMATISRHSKKYVLLHANYPYRQMTLEQAHTARYHLQEDAKRSANLCVLMDYLRKHDRYEACIRSGGDPKKVYCNKHYRKARKAKEHKAAAARLDDLFRQLETNAKLAQGENPNNNNLLMT